MSNDLITTVHDLVRESPIGAKAIAQAVGKPYSTLLREVNPYDTGAKLGAETLMHIMKTTGNVTPLEKMALEMGYRLEPVGERRNFCFAEIRRPDPLARLCTSA